MINRRAFIHSTAAKSLLFGAFPSAMARASSNPTPGEPKRLVCIFSGFGQRAEYWYPNVFVEKGTYFGGRDFTQIDSDDLGVWNSAKFRSIQKKVTLVRGLDGLPGFSTHTKNSMMTGYFSEIPRGPSIDQIIRSYRSISGFCQSLHLAVNDNSNRFYGGRNISWSDRGHDITESPTFHSGQNAAQQMFSGYGNNETGKSAGKNPEDIQLMRQILADFESISGLGSKFEQEKEDQLRLLDDLVQYLENMPEICSPPVQVSDNDISLRQNRDLQLEVLIKSLQCGLASIATLTLDPQNLKYGFIKGVSRYHHDLTHDLAGGTSSVRANAKSQLRKISSYHVDTVLELVRRLDEIPDEDGGSMLDHTLVFWGSDQGTIRNHDSLDMPVFLAGGGATLGHGRFIDYRGEIVRDSMNQDGRFGRPYNDVLVSILKLFRIPVDHYRARGRGLGDYSQTINRGHQWSYSLDGVDNGLPHLWNF